ncbi:MAG: hypothetical protein Q8Q48_01060 [Candidatus Staskawiczbacteria bacterium]|nr:hypothetical protein [Candidatus Staskawiczbacteria bacterium]
MADQNKNPERRVSAGEQKISFGRESAPVPEKKEVSQEERMISKELMREIELMEADDKTKDEAKVKAKKIEFLGEEQKLEHLLKIAKEKGVAFAIQVARRMNDPYLLDVFHDLLAKEGYYKNFAK